MSDSNTLPPTWPTWVQPEARLPAGITCSDCAHLRRCVSLGFTKPENTYCDFIPIRFDARWDGA